MARTGMTSADDRYVVTAAEQRRIDERAYEGGVERDALMESAGAAAARWVLDRHRPARVLLLTGPGGNGGDGLVAARHLHEAGVRVTCVALFPPAAGTATARMAQRLAEAGAPPLRTVGDRLKSLDGELGATDLVVDALFGCGATRPLAGGYREAVERLNDASVPVVSLDLPSGLDADRGAILGPSVAAETTLAMAFLKPAHVLHPAAARCGEVTILPVDYPPGAVREIEPWGIVPSRSTIRGLLPERAADGHKGTFGRLLVIAGSPGMAGAAILCCRAALRAGAGLVFLGVPEWLAPIVDVALPEVLTIPLPRRVPRAARRRTRALDEAIGRCDVLAIGPGLREDARTASAAAVILDRFAGTIVVDAGALPVIRDASRLERLAARVVLTPHPGEMARLTGRSTDGIAADPRGSAVEFARSRRCVLLLKGAPTIVASPEGEAYINPTGHHGLATGGSGDVLTGLIAGLLAGGATPLDAALAGAYVHGTAAERFARHGAPRSTIPSDLIELLPGVLREVEG
ncbi:MAG: NAD(P)H-hydrate dehydratase [Candidatus Bipolaricaulota bacterium]|nr:MAG: NAD(P)H-hydrate dehydratase [Candidatus Bipolaricaulota bacterium]